MGQQQIKVEQEYTRKDLKQAIEKILEHSGMVYCQNKISKPIQLILRQFSTLPPLSHTLEGLHISKVALHMLTNRRYPQSLIKLLKLFIDRLDDILQLSNLMLVDKNEWKEVGELGKIIVLLSDEKLLDVFNSLYEMYDYDGETKQTVQKIKMVRFFQGIGPMIDRLSVGEVNKIQEIIMRMMNKIIQFRQSLLTRSSSTFHFLRQLEYVCFIMYNHLYFCQEHHLSLKYQTLNQYSKYTNSFKVATYFMVLGLDQNNPTIYDLAVIYLQSLTEIKKYPLDQTILPSYLFGTVPTCHANELASYIIFYCLFSMQRVQKGEILIQRYNCNRIMSYKLIKQLVVFVNYNHEQNQIMLENLCLSTEIYKIQRSYLAKICQAFLHKRLTNEQSKILCRYAETSKISYEIKSPNLIITQPIESAQLIQLLKDNINTYKHYQSIYIQKFIYDHILDQNLQHNYTDEHLWQYIIENNMKRNKNRKEVSEKQFSATENLSKQSTFKTMDEYDATY